MARIRRDCVWTRRIDHDALLPYLLEEAAELVEAVESGTTADVVEELGDVLWQVVFHAEIATSAGEGYDLAAVMTGITDKMVRRHTHVFGPDRAETVEDVDRLWSAAKAREKASRTSALDGVPSSLSAVARAQKVLGRVDARLAEEAADPDREGTATAPASPSAEPARAATEPAETVPAVPGPGEPGVPADGREEAYGRALLALVARARADGIDAEGALRRQTRELEGRQRRAEADRA
ncbi:nucleoside triphosphate pyrophosphohydrolase [Mycetocola reblochoni]|nr:nucleoside triphosphate pyrophosphohydrolase [Mycetocola reblochoni]